MLTEGESEHSLIQLDQRLFHFINGVATSDVGDVIFPFLRNQHSWIPLYLFLFGWIVFKMKWSSYRWVIALVVLVVLTDQISSHVVKELVKRLRPCNDATLPFACRLLLDYRPSGYSFTSSHATNHFGVAFFFFQTYRRYIPSYIAGVLFFAWAAAIGYAQIYVGVHYPLDIIGGALLGLCIAFLHWQFFQRWVWFGENPFRFRRQRNAR